MVKNKDLQIRDPYIYPDHESKKYYLFGSTDKNIWGIGTGFDMYIGEDLENWEGPFPVFRPDESFYSVENFWAPEVHKYQGHYYMFATFLRKDNGKRGTAILKAEKLSGPFVPHSEGPVTPETWDSLDGTLYVDEYDDPWMIFCHEWMQVEDGKICALRLTEDLKFPVGEPKVLFSASEAPWTTSFKHPRKSSDHNFVTDGPFMLKNSKNELVMLWASFKNNLYAQGISKSLSGEITGPWFHYEQPLYKNDGGHGMIFTALNGDLYLTLHSPNKTPLERPVFIEIMETETGIFMLEKDS